MPMKKSILIAGIVALTLAICLAVILLLPNHSDNQPADTTAQNLQYLFDLNHVEHITKLSFVYKDRTSISISKVEDGWQVTDRAGLPIDDLAMEILLDPLEQMLALRIINEQCEDISEYGFDTPTLTLTVTEGTSSKTYLFGSYNSHFSGYYCMVKGTKSVYLLDEGYLQNYDVTLPDLLRAEKMPAFALPGVISMTDSNGETVELSADEMSALTTLLSQTTIDRFIDYGAEKYGAYKLDRATVFALNRADGTPLTLRIAKGETDELIYLTIDDKELIYLISCENMDGLMGYLR